MKTFKKASDIKVGAVGYGGAFNMGRYSSQRDETGWDDADRCLRN